ncbi:bbs-1 [Pristionchus pacificus]|uniref:Bbs-1 n=1 Tax=Pristionchus pacificus TaxID=54126 RepID=A0A2A6BNU7_PRIPA|nr:bbs-1 [Pristionchus pacificus]|eukprot:PDM67579.1 bbs-1 [Pristionchus pacificus]
MIYWSISISPMQSIFQMSLLPAPGARWMSALSDDELRLNTNANCVSFVDTQADGDIKLIVADLGTSRYEMKLKTPTNTIGVAAGSTLFIYKALKPFYKYDLKPIELLPAEQAAWIRYWSDGHHIDHLVRNLEMAADEASFAEMSTLSQAIVMGSDEDREQLIAKVANMKERMPVNKSQMTCVASIKRSPESLVDVCAIGCENGDIQFVDTQAFQMLASVNIKSPVVFILTTGHYDVDFKVFASTRAGTIYLIQREHLGKDREPRKIATLPKRIVAIKMFAKILAVATDDCKITYYDFRGKRLKEIRTNQRIIGLETFNYEPRQYSTLLVAFQREIYMYNENSLVDVLKIDSQSDIKWIKFGAFGREEAALIIGTKSGGIIVKLFRRTAQLTDMAEIHAPKLAHNYKLNIPRRTKLYQDQTQRERDNPVHMHQMYQRDLFLLRWLVSQQFALMTTKALSTVSTSSSEAVDISVDVNGFGPTFRLTVRLSSGTPTPLTDMWLSFIYKKESFKLSDALIPVALLTPQLHRDFVVTMVDKASGNYAITCKKLYLQFMEKELNTQSNDGKTYEIKDQLDPVSIKLNHEKFTRSFGIAVQTEGNLPKIYGIPKMHKNPIKFRFITGAHDSTLKPLSIELQKILRFLHGHFRRYCYSITGHNKINRFFSIQNTFRVVQQLNTVKNKRSEIFCADFSSLFTNLPHNVVKEKLYYLIDLMFKNAGHFYTYTILVEAISPEKGLSSDIKIYLCRKDRRNPIVTAIITMPLSEMSLLD